jgi:hypothetical protein
MNKKLIFTVFALSIVAALLTIAQQSRKSMGVDVTLSMPGSSMNSVMETKKMAVRDSGEFMPSTQANIGMVEEPYMMQYQYGGDALTVNDRVQEKYAHQGVLVKDVSDYLKEVKAFITSIGGTVLSSSQQTTNGMTYGSLLTKVPVDSFDKVTTEVALKASKIVDESINAQDVTGQAVSLEDRLDELKKNILAKETELGAAKTDAEKKRLQYELDSYQRQLKSMEATRTKFDERVQFATVSITASDTMKFFDPSAQGSFWDEIKDAVRSLGGSSAVLARLAVWVLVYAVIWLPLLVGGRFIWTHLFHKV